MISRSYFNLGKLVLRAYLNGIFFLEIFSLAYRLFFIYFTKKMAQTAQLA